MPQKDGLYFCRRDLEPPHLDQLLLPVDNIPQPIPGRTIRDVARMEEAVFVKTLSVRRIVLKVPRDDDRAPDAQLALHVVRGDIARAVLRIHQLGVHERQERADGAGGIFARKPQHARDARRLCHAPDLRERLARADS